MATSSIWADILRNLACGSTTEITTLIPAGVDPHSYEPSLTDRARLDRAALIVANGAGLEEGLIDTIDAAISSGTPAFFVADHVELIPYSGAHQHSVPEAAEPHDAEDDESDSHELEDDESDSHELEDDESDSHELEDDESDSHELEDDESDSGHDDESDSGDDESLDPHLWLDPVRVSNAMPELADALINHAQLEPAPVQECLERFQATLEDIHNETVTILDSVPQEERKLVTNHDALGYFAERYGFRVIGTVLPAPSGMARTTPGTLAKLAETIAAEGVSAIFAEAQHSDDDIEALASSLDQVRVVTLFTGALGRPGSEVDSYIKLLRVNARLVADALS